MSTRSSFITRIPLPLRRVLASALTMVLVLTVSVACIGGSANPGPTDTVTGVTEVEVNDNYFNAQSISVPAGTTVTWVWKGNMPHNVVGEGFESEVQTEGEFSFTFTEPGTYPYKCTLHGGMIGEVIVTEAEA